jgi:hypothetical protein
MNDASDAFKTGAIQKSKSEVSPPQSAGATIVGSSISAVSAIGERVGKYRWMICAMLFFATTINYIDRQVLGILATDQHFKTAIGWNEAQYGYVNTVFQGAYALGLLVVGRLMDRFGTRKGFFIRDCLLVSCCDVSCAREISIWFWHCAFLPGPGRGRKFSSIDKNSRRVVSQKRTCVSYGHFQQRIKYWCDCCTSRCSIHRGQLRMAVGIHNHRNPRIHLVNLLADDLSKTGRTSEGAGG